MDIRTNHSGENPLSRKNLQTAFAEMFREFITERTVCLTLTTRFDLTKPEVEKKYESLIHRCSSIVYKHAYQRAKKSGHSKLVREMAVYEESTKTRVQKFGSDKNVHIHGMINVPEFYNIKEFINLIKGLWEEGFVDINIQSKIR